MYQCHQCDHQFTHRSSLSRHIKDYCGERHKVDCPSCGKQFNSQGIMGKHLIRCRKDTPLEHPQTPHLVSEVINVDNNHHNVNINSNNGNNHTTNVTNQIYLTRDPKFLDLLIQLKGGRQEAFNALKKAVYNEIRGEVELFGEVYLRGNDPSLWPIVCIDSKTCYFKIKNPDVSWTADPGAVKIRERYYGNYTDAVLLLVNFFMFDPIVDQNIDSPEYEGRACERMDYVDLQTIQTRLAYVCSKKFRQDMFARELADYYIRRIEDIKNDHRDPESFIHEMTANF